MRCLAGFVMFVVLYFGSCKVLGEVMGTAFISKWHAVVAVVVGLISLVACALPTVLLRLSERNEEWRDYADGAARRR